MAFIAAGGWGTGTFPVQVPYQISVPATQQATVQAGIDMWNAVTAQSGVELIVQTNEAAFINIVPFNAACNSPVGRQATQPQEVRCDLNPGSGFNAVSVAHEIGHALGLIHEHQRPDRDANITVTDAVAGSGAVNDPNIVMLPNLAPIFGVPFLERGSIASMVGDYDCNSIMHYPAGNNIGADFAARPGGCTTMGGTAISPQDIMGLQALYAVGTGNVLHTIRPVESDGWHLTMRNRARSKALRRRRNARRILRDEVRDIRNQTNLPAGFYDNIFLRKREHSGFPVFFGVEFEARDVFVLWQF